MSSSRQLPAWLTAALLGLAVTSCSQDKDEAPPAPPQPQAQPGPPAAQETPPPGTPTNCDMSQDMSKMTAEEHRQMMERCKQPQDHQGH